MWTDLGATRHRGVESALRYDMGDLSDALRGLRRLRRPRPAAVLAPGGVRWRPVHGAALDLQCRRLRAVETALSGFAGCRRGLRHRGRRQRTPGRHPWLRHGGVAGRL
ncbi:hypothetical protein G6F50_017299 [Rhizopus delemar]|uniref:Uncharacterized protein n=1 Tax=Rhizopus delemar TaxID=936053 RepID=A0A9P6XQK6_9FUNG|nr:hypothetical protein G6F50_017299 [Rhizopus delemar]